MRFHYLSIMGRLTDCQHSASAKRKSSLAYQCAYLQHRRTAADIYIMIRVKIMKGHPGNTRSNFEHILVVAFWAFFGLSRANF
jgi:hypothetical protein